MMRDKLDGVPADFFVSQYVVCRPIDWAAQFRRKAPLDLEIGFGLGDFLIRSAQQQAERNFVGVENDWPRLKKTLQKIGESQAGVGADIHNVLVLHADARVALERFFSARSLDRIFCLFPCPWPKKRHIKHRLFCREFLRLANSRLVPRGILKIVTDHRPYCEWIGAQNERTGFRLEVKTVRPRYETKYERKWREAGQEDFYELSFEKVRHINIPVKEDVPLKKYYLERFAGRVFSFHDVSADTAIVCKDYLFDDQKQAGMLRLVVAEPDITQHLWIQILKKRRQWEISVAAGQTVLPTRGVAKALDEVYTQAGGETGT